MIICITSCVIDAYSARWRSQICNTFYPKRALSRSQYLYHRIIAGRGHRRFQLRLIAVREKKRFDRLLEISILIKMKTKLLKCIQKSPKVICNGCMCKTKTENIVQKTFRGDDNEKIIVDICDDCLRDEL